MSRQVAFARSLRIADGNHAPMSIALLIGAPPAGIWGSASWTMALHVSSGFIAASSPSHFLRPHRPSLLGDQPRRHRAIKKKGGRSVLFSTKYWRNQMQMLRSGSLVAIALLALGGPALAAGNNNSPPAPGRSSISAAERPERRQAVNNGPAELESVDFTAGVSMTNITFAFREDPAFISFSDVMLVDLTNPSGNLILNGDFSSGSGEMPTDWTFANIYGAEASGEVSSSCGGGLSTCWFDGSVQAYDAITQEVATTVGDVYALSFMYSDDSSLPTMSDLSTNGDTTDTGGNGIDILAYAQAGLPTACAPGTICAGGVILGGHSIC